MISVLILTARRGHLLHQCLDALHRGTRVPDETIVLVTSEDSETLEVLVRHPLPNLQWHSLGARSASYAEARNTLARLASHEKVAFIDDDCVAALDWLERCERSLDRFDAVGGFVSPGLALAYPAWWHPDMGWLAGLSVPGALTDRMGSRHYPACANLAFRRSVLRAEPYQEVGGTFSSSVGDYATGREDAELWRRLRVKGYSVSIDPDIWVRHLIPQERLDYATLLRRAQHDGAALVRREKNQAVLRQAWRENIYHPLSMFRSFLKNPLPNDPQRSFDRLWIARQRAVIKSWRELADEQARRAERAARREAIRHLIESEFKRPVGQAILCLNRLLRPRRTFRKPPRKALVASAGFLGDSILTAFVVNSWRKRWPEMGVDAALSSGSGMALLSGQRVFDHVFHIGADGKDNTDSLKSVIKRGDYDVIVSPYFHPSAYPKVTHLFRPLGPPVVMFAQDNGLQRRSDLMRADWRLHRNLTRNELLALADLFSIAAEVGPPQPWRPSFSEEELESFYEFYEKLNLQHSPVIALHPGAGRPEKEWVWERWFELAQNLEKTECQCLFICDDTLRTRIEQSIEEYRLSARVLAPDIRKMAMILEQMDLLISPDTGPRHLASAMGTPTVCILGNIDERRWAPYFHPELHINVRACSWDLSEEELSGLPSNHQCSLVTVEQVHQAAASMLNSLRNDS